MVLMINNPINVYFFNPYNENFDKKSYLCKNFHEEGL